MGLGVYPVISYGLFARINRSSMLVQGLNTTFGLSAADDDWKV
jgi:hypothetical protein